MTEQLDDLTGKTNIHTLLIGSSIIQKGEAFFYTGTNSSIFWGTLSEVNNDFDGTEQTSQLISKGVFLFDISATEDEEKDGENKKTPLQQGFGDIEELLQAHPTIERIGFIGKQAAKLFYIHFIKNINIQGKGKLDKANLFEYGKQKWVFNYRTMEIICFILSNSEEQWKIESEDWIEFWNEAFE